MTPSIRTFLLINLLLSVTLVTSLAIIGNLFLAHRDIQTQLDTDLLRATHQMQAMFSDYRKGTRNLSLIQHNLLSNFSAINSQENKQTTNSLEFQIWDSDGVLILHSKNTPKTPLSNGKNGFSHLWLNNQTWHINTSYEPKTQLTFMVAEPSDYRQELENILTRDSILIMILTYPFLGVLIWIIVGRGLDTLKKIAQEVKHRAPSYLEPVDIEAIPTEIEPLIAELNNLFTRLKEAFEREKRFTADAAHELRTPLAALSTHTQIALRAKTAEERKDALLKVLAGVNRSTHLIQQLLTLSRMVPEASIQEPICLNLSTEAAEIAAQLAPDAIAKNIELELLPPEEITLPPYILANPTAINVLIRNLVDNAIRYSPEGSTVTIKIGADNYKVILQVIDNGPGIPEELRMRVFERFFRILGTQATGSGLGLSIVWQIAKLHQAEIALLTPSNGQGLNFQIIFPRYEPPSKKQSQTRLRKLTHKFRGKHL